MKTINNRTERLGDELQATLRKGSRIAVAAETFSIYAYERLKKQLEAAESFRFIFTSQTFVEEKTPREQREFYIPRLAREKGVCGTAFEVKLRNELTQKAVARACADWIRRKAHFKSNTTRERMQNFITADACAYAGGVTGFTSEGLGYTRGNEMFTLISKMETPQEAEPYIQMFETLWRDASCLTDVTEQVCAGLLTAYRENAPEAVYYLALRNIFSAFLEDVSEDDLANAETGFKASAVWQKLYPFQRDAVLGIIHRLERFNGCILADSVGLGKTFTALAVIKYYEARNKNVLVLCPKKLAANWNTYKANYRNNPIAKDRLRYDVLFHTDLSRDYGDSNGLNLERLNWNNYDLVVIDESHAFRNGGQLNGKEEKRENRYLRLLNRVIRPGVKTKVLMLSATPVNNGFLDLRHQLELAYEGEAGAQLQAKLGTARAMSQIFSQAQGAFSRWNKRPPAQRTTEELLSELDPDFFTLLDQVTLARSRKHIETYYGLEEIGRFPTRLPPISERPPLTDLPEAVTYRAISEALARLNLGVYMPTAYVHESCRAAYEEAEKETGGLTQAGREAGIQRLMSINLLKRLESSVYAFRLTIGRILALIQCRLKEIEAFERNPSDSRVIRMKALEIRDWDGDDQNEDAFVSGRTRPIKLAEMDRLSWKQDLEADAAVLSGLLEAVGKITPEHDTKLQALLRLIDEKAAHPINPGNKKMLIFSAFSDTADYLYEHVSRHAKARLGLETAEITGSQEGKTTVPGLRADFNQVLTAFSPISKERDMAAPGNAREIDLLVATDCISEGQNLQDCDYLVNYDIHWNPVRIIQRFGRIDRIGSRNEQIQLVNFWPDVALDEYIHLKSRVESRMKLTVLTSTGDDDLLDPEAKGDLEYRKLQLQRLQSEVLNLEDMREGLSITDLGLNEFRLDLQEYARQHPELERMPNGLHGVVGQTAAFPPGVIFVLKNTQDALNSDKRNRIHPFYMVYVNESGETECGYLNPKRLLDSMRALCRGKSEPCQELCKRFNDETDDGKQMGAVSHLLNAAIRSITEAKDQSDLESLFHAGGTTALEHDVSGLDDFELLCFLVIRNEK